MNGSTSLKATALVASVLTTPMVLAQASAVATPPPWTFIGMLSGFGMLMILGIIAIVFFNDARKGRDKLRLVERLVTEGKPVPHGLMVNERPPLTLPEERRRDIRRGIAFLCWGIGVSVVFYIVSGGIPQSAAWGLLLILPGLGNFLKAWLTPPDIARGLSDPP